MALSRDELIELFREAPKESFELLLRNLKIREHLRVLHAKHVSGLKLSYDANFDSIFEEFFRFFFRPLEAAVYGARQLRFLFFMFDLGLMEFQSETLRAYSDFLRSWFDHLRLTSELMLGKVLPTSALDVFREFIRTHREKIESPRVDLGYAVEYPFLLPKSVLTNLEKSIEHWERFSEAFKEYRRIIKETYVKAAERFIEEANRSRFEDYQVFAGTFSNFEAQAFDEVLKSEDYLRVQKSMLDNLMDYIYFYRRFLEEMLESNPLNPFATVSMLDEAFRRILELKRRISELEKRISEKGIA
ncbi:MAG: hypothetical protein DSO02_00475 [Hadesarchaea archaeon]|nr:MAG: hypothetical protein DSO03_00945 [Hadesarchaea archaeon]TDA36420.1 MAG: hypothetical protein DSO02_00475 [Hadesarchaea archaeon]